MGLTGWNISYIYIYSNYFSNWLSYLASIFMEKHEYPQKKLCSETMIIVHDFVCSLVMEWIWLMPASRIHIKHFTGSINAKKQASHDKGNIKL